MGAGNSIQPACRADRHRSRLVVCGVAANIREATTATRMTAIAAVAAARTGRQVAGADAVDASGIATLRVLFRHAATPAPDAQAGPP